MPEITPAALLIALALLGAAPLYILILTGRFDGWLR